MMKRRSNKNEQSKKDYTGSYVLCIENTEITYPNMYNEPQTVIFIKGKRYKIEEHEMVENIPYNPCDGVITEDMFLIDLGLNVPNIFTDLPDRRKSWFVYFTRNDMIKIFDISLYDRNDVIDSILE